MKTAARARRDDLERAWPVLDGHDLAALLARPVDPLWRATSDRKASGPCPRGRGACRSDPRGAFVYTRDDGGPPWIHCGDKRGCRFKASVFDVLAERLGRYQAALAIRYAAERARCDIFTERAGEERARLNGPPPRPSRPTPADERGALARELGVDLGAPAADRKRALRDLAKRHHPDLGGDGAVMAKVARLLALERSVA